MKPQAPAPGSAPGANRTPSGFTEMQKPCPGSRPLLGTEQCHGGDNGLCLAGCENIRRAWLHCGRIKFK
ncbi:rCG51319 [Rattus norvegicus]|uniref:RCG51319 n=1 Tax=Rattus norvegicus TaxID=10116 RepID=A6IZ14_RAT|nr:rCG51319 [Rattus norvegicus]